MQGRGEGRGGGSAPDPPARFAFCTPGPFGSDFTKKPSVKSLDFFIKSLAARPDDLLSSAAWRAPAAAGSWCSFSGQKEKRGEERTDKRWHVQSRLQMQPRVCGGGSVGRVRQVRPPHKLTIYLTKCIY